MMFKYFKTRKFINYFSLFTICIAILHCGLETLYTIKFGQTWTGFLPDYIAVALMISSAIFVINNPNSVGLLCGAWGFSLCLHYRSWAWRFDEVVIDSSPYLINNTMCMLLYTMPVSIFAFIICCIMCVRSSESK